MVPSIVFFENVDQRTTQFNPYCVLRTFLPRDNTVHPIIVFLESFGEKTIWFNPYCLLRKF